MINQYKCIVTISISDKLTYANGWFIPSAIPSEIFWSSCFLFDDYAIRQWPHPSLPRPFQCRCTRRSVQCVLAVISWLKFSDYNTFKSSPITFNVKINSKSLSELTIKKTKTLDRNNKCTRDTSKTHTFRNAHIPTSWTSSFSLLLGSLSPILPLRR